MDNLKNILLIIVIYEQDIVKCKTIASLIDSAIHINSKLDCFIYDNSNKPQQIIPHLKKHLNIFYKHDHDNPGVSKAYNCGALYADAIGKKWILLSDQDTEYPQKALAVYTEQIAKYKEENLFAPILYSNSRIYSPCKYVMKRGIIWNNVTPGIYNLSGKMILNSGLMVSLEAYQKIDGYREKIKLYYSDFNFIERFQKQNKKFVVIPLICNHEISDLTYTDKNSAIARFDNFCQGGFSSVEMWTDYFKIWITIFPRAVKLGINYRSIKFIKIFFKNSISIF